MDLVAKEAGMSKTSTGIGYTSHSRFHYMALCLPVNRRIQLLSAGILPVITHYHLGTSAANKHTLMVWCMYRLTRLYGALFVIVGRALQ